MARDPGFAKPLHTLPDVPPGSKPMFTETWCTYLECTLGEWSSKNARLFFPNLKNLKKRHMWLIVQKHNLFLLISKTKKTANKYEIQVDMVTKIVTCTRVGGREKLRVKIYRNLGRGSPHFCTFHMVTLCDSDTSVTTAVIAGDTP